MSNRTVTLVGAGPGDPDLISLKGVKALRKAKVVLYDALVNPSLLEHAPKNALKVFVGKRAGKHTFKQEQINQLIVEYTLKYGSVVRLKGGDPFVFGRGHEELSYAEAFDLKTELIPGISSSISVPELQRIPLTTRGVNESFWVITGTTKSGKISSDIKLAAQSSTTVIILMGMKKLPEIAAIFEKYGKANTSVAVIQNGSLPNEKIGIAKVHTINAKVAQEGLGNPAIIVIGDVVDLHRSQRDRLLSEQLDAYSFQNN